MPASVGSSLPGKKKRNKTNDRYSGYAEHGVERSQNNGRVSQKSAGKSNNRWRQEIN